MKLQINAVTGETTVIPLSESEISDRQAFAERERVRMGQERVRLQRDEFRRQLLDQLAAKIEADPTILDRIK